MKKPPKRHLALKDLFDFLCSTKNSTGWAQAPSGHALIKFLSKEIGVSQAPIGKKINELAELGYIEKDFRGDQKKILWRVKILIDTWDETRLTEKHEREKIALEATRAEQIVKTSITETPANLTRESAKVTTEKRYAIFMDYKNLEMGLPRSTDRFRDFSWLLNPILQKGKIIFAFVFIPDHYVSRAPIMQLTHKHHFHAIFCPRQIGKAITKEADTVDTQMQELAWALVENSNITDVVIITGDRDFQRLATHAKWQQKKVTMVSTEKAISGMFLEMEKDGSLAIQLIS